MIWRRTLVLFAAGLCLMVVQAQRSRDYSNEFLANPSGRAFMQTYGALKTGYLNEIDEDHIIQGAITGMIASLDDPFSYYLEPHRAAREEQDRTGSFEGIGAVMIERDRTSGTGVEVLNVYREGPAFAAGLRRGDIFLEIDGEDVREATVSEVVDLVRGPAGSIVRVSVQRPGEVEPILLEIERSTIAIVDVESAILPNGVGYLSVLSFRNQRVYDQLVEQLAALQEAGVTSLILDLRDNGGGLLTQGILVADEFLGEGDIVFQRSRGVTQRLATADAFGFSLPMVVLVNENSASASEIVAGALQENGRALVVGEETFGKGVAQSVISLSDGGQLAYLAFEWLLPSMRSINQQGITPDVYAEDTRFPDVVRVEGEGIQAGAVVQIVVDGEAVGEAVVQEDGTFSFLSSPPHRELSEVQGEALVDLEADGALRIAYQTVLEQVEASRGP